ncbi:Acetyltransferase (GNAT) family protein [Nocardioides exalbidus]|uniref:Acetyltransferase (GNAT) family protein n=1 Tax=Nocardioides exalbidus TaxID=402596 RepID=A0A1H4UL94_9ACTN|nr:GNAT family N-acetyltransferase [Nocardioides exalbidus]SEC69536.1 Acetyltransferase (GNAT) family protein [Nocardioides exalbidus]
MDLPATSLRRATPADVAGVAALAEAAYSPYVERMGGLRPGPMDVDYAAALASDDVEGWVADVDGVIGGYLLLVPEDDGLLLDNVAVHPSLHGRGLGRALLSHAELRARALGLSRIRLYTHVSMVENQRLYAHLGYVETHRATTHGFTRVFFAKDL